MARQMVINYGMSDIGPWSLLDPSAQSGDVVMRMMARNSMSENLQQRIDEAVKKIAEEAYEVALKHIRENRYGADANNAADWICTPLSALTYSSGPSKASVAHSLRRCLATCCDS